MSGRGQRRQGEWFRQMKIYLASPLGFAESTRLFMEHLAERLRQYAEVLNPWDQTELGQQYEAVNHLPTHQERITRYQEINTQIGALNAQMVREADTIVAVLDGVDVDSGTAAEIGYGYGLGKRLFGLRTDIRQSGENEGGLVNLQVRYFIDHSGGTVVTTVDELIYVLFGEND
jgi:nucleoside 2-deoxyribosyltransferase